MNTNLIILLLTGALVGGAAGFLGSFMVLKRMSLVGDALSHVALPGIAIALTLGINPMLGAFVALTLAVIGIWYLGEKSEIYPEALVGIFFTTSLAVGILLTPQPEIFEALFGNLDKVGTPDGIITAIGAIVIFAVTLSISKKLILGIISSDLAKAGGINISRLNLIFLLLVGLVVALGVKFVGTILTGALVIIPAATSKNLAKGIKGYQAISILVGIAATVIGILLARSLGITSGPVIVIVSVGLFVLSYTFKK